MRLEAELVAARLDALKMQLHPHFLFNTLNGISTLMYRDTATADRMLTKLSTLLRTALDRSDVHELPLSEELSFLEEYLAIERLRFGDELSIQFQIEPELKNSIVPSFLFQPLVENAIKHGFEGGSRAGTITISCRQEDNKMLVEVSDDGVGLDADKDVMTSGVGLSNLHDRLSRMYGSDFEMSLIDGDPSGLRVILSFPYRSSSPD